MLGLGGGAIISLTYVFDYTPEVARLITQMKYCDRPGIAELLAGFLGPALEWSDERAALIPVPVHPSKIRGRGYNQSRILAERLARQTGRHSLLGLLVKTRRTAPQAGLERQERLTNVKGSISFGPRGGRAPASALLVDDVVTTGATLRECARVLLSAGTEEICACAVASSSL
jgi:ComF family protein